MKRLVGLGWLLLVPSVSLSRALERTPILTTPHLTFYSDFDTNLNDALIAAGVAQKQRKPELDGQRTLSEAATSLIEALRSQGKAQSGGAAPK